IPPIHQTCNGFSGLLGSLRNRENRNVSAALEALLEGHFTFRGREEGMVSAHTDVQTREEGGAALTHDDVARNSLLATIELHAQTTASTVAAVAGRTACLFMCHGGLLLRFSGLAGALRFLGSFSSRSSFGFGSLGRFGGGLGSAGGFMRNHTGSSSANSSFDARLIGALLQNLGDPHQRQMLAVTTGALRRMLPAALVVGDGFLAFDLVDDFGLHRSTGHNGRADGRTDHQNFVELDFFASNSVKLFNAQNVTRLHF